MSVLSKYAEDKLLDHLLGSSEFTMPANLYVGLFLTDPLDTGTGTEIVGNGYTRLEATFSSSSNGIATNTNELEFQADGGDWGHIGYIGIFDASTAGNLILFGKSHPERTIQDGDYFTFEIGKLGVRLN